MQKEQATQIMAKIAERLGKDWNAFIDRISKEVEQEDSNLIKYSKFLKVLSDFNQ